jgi:hypothetical protein
MSMKPLLGDHAKPIQGVVNNPTPTAAHTAIPGTVTTSKEESNHKIGDVVTDVHK